MGQDPERRFSPFAGLLTDFHHQKRISRACCAEIPSGYRGSGARVELYIAETPLCSKQAGTLMSSMLGVVARRTAGAAARPALRSVR